jgi:hypothetical protein
LPRTKSILLDRKGRRHSIDLTSIKNQILINNSSSLIQNCSISLRTRPLISLIQANANAESIESISEHQQIFEQQHQQQQQCSSPKSVKSFISMQKKTFEIINTSSCQIQQQKQQQQQNEQGKAQTDLSNAFAQLLLRRNTFSTSKSYLNKPNQHEQHHSHNKHHQFGFNHLSDRSQSIAKLNSSNIFLQNHNNQNIKQSQQQQQQHQVVPNIPVSKLKAKFETKFEGECKRSATKKFGNPILFSSPKPDKKLNSPALCSLKCDLDNDEEENANDSLSTVIPKSTEYDVNNNLFDSNNETLKTSIRDEKDIIDLDMTLNDSFIIKTDLDYLNDDGDDGESFLFNIELDECPRVAQESSSSEKSEKENDHVKELKKYKKKRWAINL